MGLRRFFADCSDCTEEGVLGVKIGPKVASDFYTQLYTFCQRSLGTRMDARFFDSYDFENCTFNPFVVGSTPARPTTESPLETGKPTIKLIVGFFVSGVVARILPEFLPMPSSLLGRQRCPFDA